MVGITLKTTTDDKNRQQQIFICKQIQLRQDEKLPHVNAKLHQRSKVVFLAYQTGNYQNRETDHLKVAKVLNLLLIRITKQRNEFQR